MSSAAPIRILVVDAERDSAKRLSRTLARSHPELDLHPVGTVAAAREVLERHHGQSAGWDAILCTAGRRHPEGLELARALSEGASRLPLILLGDAGDIETAVEGMKIGASDFLVRGPQLSRHFLPRLRQAIDRTRSRLRRDVLLPALDALPESVLILDAEGCLVAASRACQITFGLGEEELAGQPLQRVLEISQDDPLAAEILALEPAASLDRHVRLRRTDGSSIAARLTASRMQGVEPLLLLVLRPIDAVASAPVRAVHRAAVAPRVEPLRIEREETDPPRPEKEARPAPREPLRVLLVDDEDAILELLVDVLQAEGHRVETARSGEAALVKLEGGSYDLLITDLKMPGFDGRQLCERWQSQDPNRAGRVLITTGDTGSEETREYLQQSGVRYLLKPFDIEELKGLIRSVLEERLASGPGAPAERASGSLHPEPEIP